VFQSFSIVTTNFVARVRLEKENAMQTKIALLGMYVSIFGLLNSVQATAEMPRGIPIYTCTLKINGVQAGMSGTIIVDSQHLNSGTYLGISQDQDGLHSDRFAGEVIAAPTGGTSNFLLRIKDSGEFTTGIQEVIAGALTVAASYKSSDGQQVDLGCTFGRL
jgi:hypothetical protein